MYLNCPQCQLVYAWLDVKLSDALSIVERLLKLSWSVTLPGNEVRKVGGRGEEEEQMKYELEFYGFHKSVDYMY